MDALQRKRIGFFALGALSYLPTEAFLLYAALEGVLPFPVFWSTLATHLLVNGLFLGMFLTGRNLRWEHDRTLALPQIIAGIVSNWWVLAIVGPLRSTYLVFCVTPLLFGAFKLRTRQMFGLATMAQVGHLATVLLLHRLSPGGIDLRHETMLWITLSTEMLWVACIAAMIGNLRRRLLAAHEESHRLAHSDPLTGVLNRRALIARAEAVAVAARAASGTAECRAPMVALLDLDHFKAVNDSYGHDVGDRLLVAFADAVRSCLRDTDIFGRYGGDEFVLCLEGRQASHAREVFERLQRVIGELELKECPEITVSVSIGATSLRPGETLDTALQRADAILYAVKRNGRGRFAFDESPAIDPAPARRSVAGAAATAPLTA